VAAEPEICVEAGAIHLAEPVVDVSAPESVRNGLMGLAPSLKALINEDSFTDLGSCSSVIGSNLATTTEVDEACMEGEADLEEQDEREPELESESVIPLLLLPKCF
jgi:hypothetical protein